MRQTQTLHEILLEVETKKFENDMWAFSVEKYFHLSKKYEGDKLTEKWEQSLDHKYNSSKRNRKLLENMDIGYLVNSNESDEEFNTLLEQFTEQMDDDSISEEVFTETAQSMITKMQELKENPQISEGMDFLSNLKEKWALIKSKWNDFLGAFSEWIVEVGMSTMDLIILLVRREFMDAFKFTMGKLFTNIKQLMDFWANTVGKIQDFIFGAVKRHRLGGKQMDKWAKKLDEKLNKTPDTRWKKMCVAMIGFAVVTVTYQIWTKMFFIGDWRYDFDFSAALGTMTGAVDFQKVLGSEWIPTLVWFIAGMIQSATEWAIPCPPKCPWFDNFHKSGNLIAAGFVTAYILMTNGSLADIKNSKAGRKIKDWLKTVKKDDSPEKNDPEAKNLIKKGKLLITL